MVKSIALATVSVIDEAEIVPVVIPQKKGDPKIFDTDEHARPETTLEGLGKLKPAFKKDGTVTAGNASGINDAGAAFVVASKDYADKHGLKPLATKAGLKKFREEVVGAIKSAPKMNPCLSNDCDD